MTRTLKRRVHTERTDTWMFLYFLPVHCQNYCLKTRMQESESMWKSGNVLTWSLNRRLLVSNRKWLCWCFLLCCQTDPKKTSSHVSALSCCLCRRWSEVGHTNMVSLCFSRSPEVGARGQDLPPAEALQHRWVELLLHRRYYSFISINSEHERSAFKGCLRRHAVTGALRGYSPVQQVW